MKRPSARRCRPGGLLRRSTIRRWVLPVRSAPGIQGSDWISAGARCTVTKNDVVRLQSVQVVHLPGGRSVVIAPVERGSVNENDLVNEVRQWRVLDSF